MPSVCVSRANSRCAGLISGCRRARGLQRRCQRRLGLGRRVERVHDTSTRLLDQSLSGLTSATKVRSLFLKSIPVRNPSTAAPGLSRTLLSVTA